MDNLITAGELAKLASTTKRTILYYDEKGVLKPVKVNSSKYRYYLESQILDYQRILLLSTLGVSLDEMKKYLRKNGNLAKLFDDKKGLVDKEIQLLEFNLQSLTRFESNLKTNGTMVNPEIKVCVPEFQAKGGHPILFLRDFADLLLNLNPENTDSRLDKQIANLKKNEVLRIPVNDANVTFGFNTKDEWAEFLNKVLNKTN